jgi:hypothetical protein
MKTALKLSVVLAGVLGTAALVRAQGTAFTYQGRLNDNGLSQEFLLRRQNFSLPVPMPAVLGKSTNYPTECVVCYDEEADACHIVFKGFEPIE